MVGSHAQGNPLGPGVRVFRARGPGKPTKYIVEGVILFNDEDDVLDGALGRSGANCRALRLRGLDHIVRGRRRSETVAGGGPPHRLKGGETQRNQTKGQKEKPKAKDERPSCE
jgi:hypothetical protein